ncbi:MAG: DEAD/DEAH box helicase, partial [Pseudomonadota bacterium]
MNGPTYDLPSDIGELGKKSFSTPLLEEGLRLFRTAKTMLSFKKGSPDNYYIVSGIVRTHRSFETKVVYKKRLEDSGQPPLTSNCDCHQWKTNEHCSHVVCLFLHYHLQLYLQKSGSSGILLPDSIPVNNFAVRPQHYGTIIPGPSKLLGASPNSTYSTQQYLLTDGRIINFPVPAPFNGKMIIWIDTSTLITEEDLSRQVPVLQFKYQGTEGPLVSEISLFEGLYLFNWNDGQAYHLPREINEFVQGRRNSTEEITLENLINIGYSWQQKNLAEVIIDSQSLSQMPQENGQMQIHVRPANEGSDLLFSAVFHDQQKNKISPPSILPALTFEGGLLGTFHSKKDAYRFLSSLAYCFEEKSHAYKKQLIGNKFRTQWSRLIASVLEGSHCLIYDHLLKKTYLFDNEIIKAFYSALWKNFHELFFRYSCYEQETREIQFQISPRILFEGLASFYERVIPLGIGVFYQLGEISHWAPRIRFERRLSSTQWFDLDLQISALDLEVIGKTQLDSRLVLTKKGLVYLSPEQKDLIRFMKKYTQHEGQPVDLKKEKVDDLTETTKEELKDEDIRKFAIPFNRSRIFELFELKKFGLDGALTEAEQELCRRLSTLTDMPEYPIPSGLESILRPYQKIGYQWLRFLHENMLGACLADDMGLGKTLQAIAFIESIYDSIQRVLIVCPVTLLLNWEKEFAKFGTLHPVLYHGGERIFPQDSKIILTSYGVIKKDIDGILVEQHFD